MKKIILILVAALCSTALSAQHLQLIEPTTHHDAPAKLNVMRKAAQHRITPATYSIISNQPEGTLLTNVVWSSIAGTPNTTTGRVDWIELSGFTPRIVVNGNKMYIQSPLTQFSDYANNWIEGTIKGELVTFHTPQAYFMNASATGFEMLYLTRLDGTTGRIDASNLDIVFSYKDGNLKQIDGGVLALTDINGNFYGYAEQQIEVNKITDEAISLPDGAELKTYLLTFSGKEKQTAKVAFVGNEVYISDPVGIEDAWMKGTIEGNTISIPTKQYLGAGSGYPLYVQSGERYTYTQTNALGQLETLVGYRILNDESIKFQYDAAAGTFSSNQLLLINAGKNDLGPAYVAIDKPSYSPWTQVKATPANPSINQFVDLTPYAQLGFSGSMLAYTIPTVDVNGEFISQESLYYQICIDGKPYELYGTSIIPYYGSVTDEASGIVLSLNGSTHQLQIPDVVKNSVSIQSFYVVDGESTPSAVVAYNIVNGELEPVDAIKDIKAGDFAARSKSVFNLAGQRVDDTYKGIVVKNGKKILKK